MHTFIDCFLTAIHLFPSVYPNHERVDSNSFSIILIIKLSIVMKGMRSECV